MQIFILPSGHKTMVSKRDAWLFLKYRFFIIIYKTQMCVRAVWYENGKRKEAKLHRLIMGVTDKKILVDHRDRNPLNNVRSNLRVCNTSDNAKNRPPRGTSKYMGVNRRLGYCWVAKININGRQKHLGCFQSEIEAAKAYNKAAVKTGNKFYNKNILV